jgi:UMP-CMP kinase
VDQFGFVHLSAGDLLRAERQRKDSPYAAIINDVIINGKITPVEITVSLIKQAMSESGWTDSRFLIDGFPRNEDNDRGWKETMQDEVIVEKVLAFSCKQELLI